MVDPLVAFFAGITGYLIGSISFARLMVAGLAHGSDVETIEHQIPGGSEVFESGSVSATAVRFQLGDRYGCLAALLDMLKALVPTLAFKLWFPGEFYYLFTAPLAIVGHNYRVF